MARGPARAQAAPGIAQARAPETEPLEDLEIRLLLEGLWCSYGYDFRDYALSSIRRRVRFFMQEEGISTVSSVQDRVLHDTLALRRLLRSLSVNVTAMFRDTSFYRALREVVVPVLRTYPAVRICTPAARRAKRCIRWRSCCTRRGSPIAAACTRRT